MLKVCDLLWHSLVRSERGCTDNSFSTFIGKKILLLRLDLVLFRKSFVSRPGLSGKARSYSIHNILFIKNACCRLDLVISFLLFIFDVKYVDAFKVW